MAILKKEPAVIIGVIGGAIIAAIQVLAPELFPELEDTIIQGVQVMVAILTLIVQRMNVFSPETYERDVSVAFHELPPEAGDGPSPES